jgi:serine/threonine protein kinase
LPAGTVLDGRFLIRERLGSGAFGDVYLARQLVLGKPMRDVALKIFRHGSVTGDDAASAFADAIVLLGLLEDGPPPEVSARMVQVYDMGTTTGPEPVAYIAMRLIPGRRTLRDVMLRYRVDGMPVATAAAYLSRTLVPLAWMHGLDPAAVHGDLKPENVLLTDGDDIVLTDFGLSARVPLGALGGTLPYQAPEVLLGRGGGPGSDVFSLGVIWYEMLTGHGPFEGVGLEAAAAGDDTALVRAHHAARKWPMSTARAGAQPSERIARASERNTELTDHPQLEAALERCLAYLPSDRYPNAGSLHADLTRYAESGTMPAQPRPRPRDTGLPALNQRDDTALLADVRSLIQRGDAERALVLARSVLERRPAFVPAIVAEARALAASGDAAAALDRLARARASAPGDADLLDAHAEALEATGKRATADGLRRQAAALRQSQRGGRR